MRSKTRVVVEEKKQMGMEKREMKTEEYEKGS